jgi:hypothetical protein
VTPQDQHKVEARLRDLMVLGDIAACVGEASVNSGEEKVSPEWFGLFGRLTRALASEASDLLGDLPKLD